MRDRKRPFMDCAESGVNAITQCEEAFYPWNSARKTTQMLDTINKITGRSSYNVEDCGLALAKVHGAGLSLEDIAREIAVGDNISGADRQALIEQESFAPRRPR